MITPLPMDLELGYPGFIMPDAHNQWSPSQLDTRVVVEGMITDLVDTFGKGGITMHNEHHAQ